MVHTWCPSLLNYPHKYLILAAAPYLPVVLINTNKLKRRHHQLSDLANAHACLLIRYPPFHKTSTLVGRIYSAARGQPHTSLITITTASAREDIRDHV